MSYKMGAVIVAMLVLATAVLTQTTPTVIIADPADQARIKPLIDTETKAREALLAKTATLPESAAVKATKDAYDKALAELNKASEKLPEYAAWKVAGANAWRESHRILAEHKLSSLEHRPELNAKGELVFTKIETPRVP